MSSTEVAVDTTVDLFDTVVARAGQAVAFVDGDRRLTFAEWARAADGLASRLAGMGVGRGDVVGVCLPSSIEFAVAYQAAMRLGAITSGMNPRLGPAEVDHVLERSEPVVVVTDAAVAGVPTISAAEVATAADQPALVDRPRLRAEDPVAIVWTSGTTGRPKGSVFDHACLRAMAEGAGALSAPGDRRLSPLPFAHVGSMTRVWDELANAVTTVIVPTPWTAAAALGLIERERVTVGQGVPTQWQMMLDHPDFDRTDTSSLRLAATGAARVPPELVRQLRARLGCPVVVRYTSTEASLSTGTLPEDPVEVVAETVGRPAPGVELEVRGKDGAVRPTGEVGTICLRSRARMRGYWRDPERTAEAIDPDGWLVTNDLGFVDQRGDLRLAGRVSEQYQRGGYNVYPVEVENLLDTHPAVARAAVLGAPAPVLGEIGVAFVVPADRGAPPDLDELRAFCRARLADYKAPDAMVVVDELPLTPMAKVDKQALVESAAAAVEAWTR
jgi:acyl-CoA synthetase (AMP-forming)/AMP-acid ligase II